MASVPEARLFILYLIDNNCFILCLASTKLYLTIRHSYFMIPSIHLLEVLTTMRTIARWEPFRGVTTLQEQINRLFSDAFERTGEQSNLSAWAPAVDIYETEQELVVKADLPDVDPKDLDIRVENNLLTIRGERKFEKKVNEENYLRVERSFGSFARSFTLANTVNPDAIRAEYQNGVLVLAIPKREEAKPKQIKVNVNAPAAAAAASGR